MPVQSWSTAWTALNVIPTLRFLMSITFSEYAVALVYAVDKYTR